MWPGTVSLLLSAQRGKADVAVKLQCGADEYIGHHACRLRFLVGDLALIDGTAFDRLLLLR
jgi:hypothetical protein